MRSQRLSLLVLVACVYGSVTSAAAQNPPRILAWNDLGMHCIDPDFSVFAILPPFNTINSQLILNGKLQTGVGYRVTWEGIADPTGSINTTSINKSNFWQYAKPLFGVNLPLDVGLSGNRMPGLRNVPQPLRYDARWKWSQVEGFPITPFDDARQKNPYPLVKVTARDGAGRVLASTVTVAPNSQELQCARCHASGANPFSRPAAGWLFDPNPVRDNRLNILAKHDEFQLANPRFRAALAKAGYNAAGLLATVREDGTPVLCARCHASNALPGSGQAGIRPLTQSIHSRHAFVPDRNGKALDVNPTRTACYACHPGYDTKCLRGAMGRAIGADGNFAMECQSCHGSMLEVGSPSRVGWLDEPTCQNCHTGTATKNNGAIRYTSAFDRPGHLRQAVSPVFATTPDVPGKGHSLYRFSTGHGGLQCSACHGPPHAIYPTASANDNAQSQLVQGHEGTIADCTACHGKVPEKTLRGPHGMHPIDAKWVKDNHGDVAKKSLAACQSCHGANNLGTVLSRSLGDRTFNTKFGVKNFWKGFQIGCYNCHKGPRNDHKIDNQPPVVPSVGVKTPSDVPLPMRLTGTDKDRDPLTFRIVSQPRHGTVALAGANATYRAAQGYVGKDSFAYAAWDGKTNSNLGTVTVMVGARACRGSIIEYEFGCPGSGAQLPILSASGCPTPGGAITLAMKNGFGGGHAFVMIGTSRARFMVVDGCALRVAPVVLTVGPIPLVGKGAGNGSFRLNVPIPNLASAGTVTLQAYATDPGVGRGWSASNGLEIVIR